MIMDQLMLYAVLCCAMLCIQADKLEEEDLLIYNWKPLYTGRHESGEEEQDFQQTYVFDGVDKHQQQQHGSAIGSVEGLLRKWLSWA
jgi:hypothetical protein